MDQTTSCARRIGCRTIMEGMIVRFAAVVVLVGTVACGPPPAQRIGDVRIDIPDGWHVTRKHQTSLQMADGTAGTGVETEPGTAKAVFDLYLNTTRTPEALRDAIVREGATPTVTEMTVDGRRAYVFDYAGASFAGKRTTVLIPDARVLIEYRAAFKRDVESFERGRPALMEAVRSIRILDDDSGA